ncbi:MAG: rRNA maturation RNase YbeY [Chloroflexi bacterium]|nr:rRNA maturation RNase YbeY [Chloroflexota bacterium]
MSNHQVNIEIDEPFQESADEAWLQRLAEETLRQEGVTASVDISLVVTDDDTIQTLNRTYRGIDEPTDVLSFSLLEESSEDSQAFVAPPDGLTHLGEVVISFPYIARQAQDYRHSVEQELALVAVHGVLHLLGYDHIDPDDQRRMKSRERAILKEALKRAIA